MAGARPAAVSAATVDRDGMADLVDGVARADKAGQPWVGLGDPTVGHHEQPVHLPRRYLERVGRVDAVIGRDTAAFVDQPDLLVRVAGAKTVSEPSEILPPVNVGVVQAQMSFGRSTERFI